MAISLSKKNIKSFKNELHQAIRNQEFSNQNNIQQIEYDNEKLKNLKKEKRDSEKVIEWNFKEGQLVKIDIVKMGYHDANNRPVQLSLHSINAEHPVIVHIDDPLIVLDKQKWKSNFDYNFVVHETILCFYNNYIIPLHPSHLMLY